ncbi:hypothetical protein KGQ19_26720 [Catenulispora sp. NL8]|uniref:DUF2637 domain-containing protein n=1 Tax=Catenulispora pinistramenti TaxID=2705254 RepID=A0ABS5KWW1_9ACTN|nr:hypothetical protein [Catenulispora pinistramenti]MBS2550469.1 hypothetical protein [Catenulispora pinistramenti]
MSSTGGSSASTARSFWVYFWIYSGLVLGALASVSANIAYTYIPPRIQPAWWPRSRLWDPTAYIPPPGDVAVAVFCPAAIFILTEVITRPRWREGKLSSAVRTASAVMVGLPVAVASYLHLCSLLEYYSTIPFIAYTLPLTVDGLMLACTAALQLTAEAPKDQLKQSDGQASATDDVVVLPHPRVPLDSPHEPADVLVTRPTATSTAEIAGDSKPPPVAPVADAPEAVAPPVGQLGPPVGTELFPLELPGPPVGHDEPADQYGPPPVVPVPDSPEPVAPPVDQLGPPVGTELLPLELPGPPLPPRELDSGPPVGQPDADDLDLPACGPTGAPGEEAEADGSGRPVPFGRLGAADLTDEAIIALAMADNPDGKITGTALRKDFGVGPGRGARIRDAIARRHLAARLAAGLREQIERLRTADTPEAAQASDPTGQHPTSPDSGDMDAAIKSSSELSRPGA